MLLVLLATPARSIPTDSLKVGLTRKDMDEAEAIADLLASTARAQDDTDERRKWRHWGPDIKELKPGSTAQPYSIAVRRMLRNRDEWSKRAVATNLGNYDKLQAQVRATNSPVTVRTHAYTTKDTEKSSQHTSLPSKAAGPWARHSGFLKVGSVNTRTGLTPTLPWLV